VYDGIPKLTIEIIELRDFLQFLDPPPIKNEDFSLMKHLACFL
jgi:hypothetical protein